MFPNIEEGTELICTTCKKVIASSKINLKNEQLVRLLYLKHIRSCQNVPQVEEEDIKF